MLSCNLILDVNPKGSDCTIFVISEASPALAVIIQPVGLLNRDDGVKPGIVRCEAGSAIPGCHNSLPIDSGAMFSAWAGWLLYLQVD